MEQNITRVAVLTVKDLISLLESVENKKALVNDLFIDYRTATGLKGVVNEEGLSLQSYRPVYTETDWTDEIGCVISESLTVEKLIWVLQHPDEDLFISFVRLKGSSNMIYMGVGLAGLVIHD